MKAIVPLVLLSFSALTAAADPEKTWLTSVHIYFKSAPPGAGSKGGGRISVQTDSDVDAFVKNYEKFLSSATPTSARLAYWATDQAAGAAVRTGEIAISYDAVGAILVIPPK